MTMSNFLAIRAYKRKSLTFAGAVSAGLVSFLLVGTGTIFFLTHDCFDTVKLMKM